MNSTAIKLTKLNITVRPLNEEMDIDGNSTYEPSDWHWNHSVYKLPNGAIIVPNENNYDEFYSDLEDYASCLEDIVENVLALDSFEMTTTNLRQSVIDSKKSYGKGSIPDNVIELIQFANGD